MRFPKPEELIDLERIVGSGNPWMEVRNLCEVNTADGTLPVYALSFGSRSPSSAAIGFFGGIHGLERIGSQVVLALLHSVLKRLPWDVTLQQQLQSLRLIFVPIVNPGGMWERTRSNPSGVDLMRNAPVTSESRVPFLIGGQRISRHLPWYRGARDSAMEQESRAVCDIVMQELLTADFSIALDCHSGFGLNDRIWFPHAHTRQPLDHLPEVHALLHLFDTTYPHHNYTLEPQSSQYLTHGDLWDYLYLRANEQGSNIFIPLTLEMGSWRWIKKRPRQLLSRMGIFNPMMPHRFNRVMRAHLVFLDFLMRATVSWKNWAPTTQQRDQHLTLALQRWYQESKK